jgi:serine/threonine-protein phosphatase 5
MSEPQPEDAAADAREERLEKMEPVEYSAEEIAKSDAIKTEANAAFAAGDFQQAIELYTNAIDVVPSPALFSNRAFCHIKLEALGSAIMDADEALKLDKRFAKAYYRKGSALAMQGKNKPAKREFMKVCKLQPKNKDAAKKVKELDKIIKELAFAAAIGVEEKSEFDDLDPQNITIDGSYDGPHLPTPLTAEAVKEMTEKFKDGKKLHRKYLVELMIKAKEILSAKPSLVDLTVEEGGKLTVCGDTHGQFFDLMNIFNLNGVPCVRLCAAQCFPARLSLPHLRGHAPAMPLQGRRQSVPVQR